MMSLIFRLRRIAQYSKLTRNLKALRILSKFPNLTISALEAPGNGSEVFLQGTRINPTTDNLQFLLKGSDLIRKLVDEAKASFKAASEGVLLEVGGVKLLLQHWEELFIAEEVFGNGVYNLKIDRPFVLIDVGMNVGTTSLFFARKPNCKAVYAFELFPPTAEKAQKNLSLNPEIAHKVKITQKGLAAKSSREEMDYAEEFKGSIGIWGLPEGLRSKNNNASQSRKVTVEFASCIDAFLEISKEHANETIVCKLDCEGAEYEILEALGHAGLLSNLSCLMIEWHRKGAAAIEAILLKHGFCVLSFSPNAPAHGMVYAWRFTALE